tara:strand:+ start:1376 stop:2308 length:933 start_codon:yes stop_codon:yes gene_type:complete
MFVSVVIPTFNRLPILKKCLSALEDQQPSSSIDGYEVLIVDDGSTDGTTEWLERESTQYPHLKLLKQDHAGPAKGRNKGVENAKGDIIIFIDSDIVVNYSFLKAHIRSLERFWAEKGNRNCFTYGSVINTSDFENPKKELYKITDISWAYFATGNVAIDRSLLLKAGLFDTSFFLYGWEDLELGERLRKLNVSLVKCPDAIGYHWHPALTMDKINDLVRVEKERAKMGLVFYKKHPTLRVRFIIQYTFLHLWLWNLLTLFGLISIENIKPLLAFLIKRGFSSLAMEILRLPLNLISVNSIYTQAKKSRAI